MNSKKPKVSIIVPNFNCLSYLPSCFESIDKQKNIEKEIIIIDDGSTDDSLAYLEELQSKRDNLIVLNTQNSGPGNARNMGVKHAKSDFIAFLDADDGWYENKLAAQLAFMQANPECVLSFTNYQHVDENKKSIVPCFEFWPEFNKYLMNTPDTTNYSFIEKSTAVLFKENVVGTSSVVCRKDAFLEVNGFDNELPSASDWDLWLKLSCIGSIAFSRKIEMDYLVRSDSISRNIPKRIEAMKIISQRHSQAAQQQMPNINQFIRERIADAYCDYYDTQNNYLARLSKHLYSLIFFPNVRHLKGFIKSLFYMKPFEQPKGHG